MNKRILPLCVGFVACLTVAGGLLLGQLHEPNEFIKITEIVVSIVAAFMLAMTANEMMK
jgi:hypothetical protein